jgi:transcriptional regulator with XRE-family HTH domain
MYPNLKLQVFRKGIHQYQLARALSLDQTVLSKIIRGYREPSEAQRKLLANYLQVSETWLFEEYQNDGNAGNTKAALTENAQPEPTDGTR